jgi:protein-tyrosine phosphatase
MMQGTAHSRRLKWDGCYNIRDLGGFRTFDGRGTRRHALVRSDNLSRLTDAGWQALLAYGIRTILDLRTAWERTVELSPFLHHENSPVRYVHVPFLSDDRAFAWPHTASIEEDYILMLQEARDGIRAIVQALAHAEDGGVLFYCHSGKDRTGLIAALVLAMLGVPPDEVAADYAQSLDCLQPLQDEWLENGPGERAEREEADAKFASRPETMKIVLQHLEAEYGGVQRYLEETGVSTADVEHLRRRLIETG